MLIFLQPDHNMKSFTHRFRGLADPHIAVHGSFSVMVNYHAIGLYCTSRFGFVLHDPQEEASLKVSALVFTGDDVSSAKELEVSNTKKISIKSTSHTKDHRTSNWTGNEVERLSAVVSGYT